MVWRRGWSTHLCCPLSMTCPYNRSVPLQLGLLFVQNDTPRKHGIRRSHRGEGQILRVTHCCDASRAWHTGKARWLTLATPSKHHHGDRGCYAQQTLCEPGQSTACCPVFLGVHTLSRLRLLLSALKSTVSCWVGCFPPAIPH